MTKLNPFVLLFGFVASTVAGAAPVQRKIASMDEVGECTEAVLSALNPGEFSKKPSRRIKSKFDASVSELLFTDGPFENQIRIYCEVNRDRLADFRTCVQHLESGFTAIAKPKSVKSPEEQNTQQFYRMRHETIGSYCAMSGRERVGLKDFAECAIILRNQTPLDAVMTGRFCDYVGSKTFAECVVQRHPARPAPGSTPEEGARYLRQQMDVLEACAGQIDGPK